MPSVEHITVVGSVALDTIETPSGRVEETPGGSALYIGLAASLFTRVHLVAVVGEDFPMEALDFMRAREIDLQGVTVEPGKTFRWEGRYHADMNRRDTLRTELGVFENFRPRLPADAAGAGYLMLANIDPDLQKGVLEQLPKPRLVAFDTMNHWIRDKKRRIEELIRQVDVVIVNDEEIDLLTGSGSLLAGAARITGLGPGYVVVKKGEHGALLVGRDSAPFLCPAYPLSEAKDPTGAGDTFAGAMLGYLAATGDTGSWSFRRAVVYGSIAASFAVEDFGLERLKALTTDELEARFREFRSMVEF